MRRRLRVAVVVALAACGAKQVKGGGAAVSCPDREVTFPSTDGLRIHATLSDCGAGRPLVVLAHQMCKDRREWSEDAHPWTARLHEKRVSTLAIDLRGHGASLDWPDGSHHDLCKEIEDDAVAGLYAAMVGDVTAAVGFARGEGKAGAIGIVGASIGANSAIVAYAADPAVKIAVALSPGVDYRDIEPGDAIVALGARPIVVEAAQDDARSVEAVATFAGQNPKAQQKIWPTGGHGNQMIDAHPEELDRLVGLIVTAL